MATYVPNANQTTEPVESQTVESAALEFRTLKKHALQFLTADADASKTTLPSAVERAGKYLGFDPITGVPMAAATLPDSLYLGAYADAPTTGTNGTELSDGDLYFNLTSDTMSVYKVDTGWINYEDLAVAAKIAAETAQVAAELAETNAETAETNAETAETGALTAKVAAESARDAALIQAGVYVDEPTGRAAVADGVAFKVQGSGDVAAYEYRRTDSTTSVLIATYPSTAAISALLNIAPSGHAFAIADSLGNVVLTVDETGTVNFLDFAGDSLGITDEKLINESAYGRAWALVDSAGGIPLAVRDDGTVETKALEAETLNGVSVSSFISPGGGSGGASTLYKGNFSAEVMGVFSHGQSLSVGADATPPLTTTQRFDNLKFAGGVRTGDSGTPYTSLVALTETQNSTLGETPIAGMTDAIKELILSESGLAYTAQNYQMLGTAPGAGGTPISGLVKGTGPYTRLIADLTNGLSLANAAGKTYKAGATTWTQGESDYNGNTPAATYKTALEQLALDLDTDAKAITGQTQDFPLITYQTWAHGTYGYPTNPYIAYAQLDVAKSNTRIHMATPLYFFRNGAGFVHLTPTESKWLGAYYGLVYKRVVIDGERWLPVHPISTTKQGAIALLKFHVPSLPLVLDTVLMTLKTNYGFQLFDSGGAALTISSVSLVGPDTLKIVAAATIPAGAYVRYGTSAGGNLRDSQGETIVFGGDGLNKKMHNWCVLFTQPL
jgi:hypothetical protein